MANTVSVSLSKCGPEVISFRSNSNSFIGVVAQVIENLKALGHSLTFNDMGHKFFVSVY